MNAVTTGLKATILTLVISVFVAFILDDTIKGTLAMDVLFVAAYIAAIAVAWLTYTSQSIGGTLYPHYPIRVDGIAHCHSWQ